MADDLKPCRLCNGRGYFHCKCWPGDCICGGDDERCDECGGEGWVDPFIGAEEEEYWREMEARVALHGLRSNRRFSTGLDKQLQPKPDAKKAARRAKVKAARKQKHGGKR